MLYTLNLYLLYVNFIPRKLKKKLAEINLIQLAILFHFLIFQRLPKLTLIFGQVGTEKTLATKNRL